MKKKLAIYPYDIELAPLIRHAEMMDEYTVAEIIAPKGWGYTDKDAGVVDGGSLTGYKVGNNFEERIMNCDAVLFSNPANKINFDKLIFPKMIKTIEKGKDVISLADLDPVNTMEIKALCVTREAGFIDYSAGEVYGGGMINDESLLQTEAPVIFILGLGDYTHKFEIQLVLREKIISAGYSVSQIGSRTWSELLGFHPFPRFMFSDSISESRKITGFNRFVKNIERTENPDVILIGIPGGIMPLNDNFTNKFGITAFEVSQAITPDCALLSVYYDDYTRDYFSSLSESLRHKLGFDIDCFHIANNKIDWNSTIMSNKLFYLPFHVSFIEKRKKDYADYPVPLFNVLIPDDGPVMADFLIQKLVKYAETNYL